MRSLDILIGANGRKQAFEMDIAAALTFGRQVILAPVLKAISDKGGPPAFGPDGKVEDAVAAFYERMTLVGQFPRAHDSRDDWENLIHEIESAIRRIGRTLISPERAFR